MIPRTTLRQLSHSEDLVAPRPAQSVWPHQCCIRFEERHSWVGTYQGCFFCNYADFHVKENAALEVGICCYPQKQF